ncbi:MAG TPA: glutamyl-tRNA reductase [Thermoanaerobaculia bacterium]|nr:glutamyl-tRNA reductase [Thermoanaerobaculia bacterium]
MSLILIGLNHRTAPVDVRERLNVSEKDTADLLTRVCALGGVSGAAVLSTCNRVEIVVSAESEDVTDPVVVTLASRAEFSRTEIENHLYILRNRDVVRHLFRVSAGLDSMILGEPQIGGQMRDAYQRARELGSLDSMLQSLYEQTLRVAKRVRTETGIGEHAVSVPFAAVELARKIFGDLDSLNVLLVGAGEMGELTAQHLQGFGLKKVFVANRAHERAIELARQFNGEAVNFDSLPAQLNECDIVIVSTSAPHHVIRQSHVEEALAARKRRSLFLVDLSVPRNIEPAIAEIDGAYLYNIDDLQQVANSNIEKRQKKAEAADEIIDREVESFLRRLASHEAIPTIVELQSRLDEIRIAELEKCLRRLGPITTDQHAAIELLSTGIINKVLHYPIVRLKESTADASAPDHERLRETIRKIFGLR